MKKRDDCEVFYCILYKPENRLFSFSTDEENFTIDHIVNRIRKDMQKTFFAKRLKLYESTNFLKIQQNFLKIKAFVGLKNAHDFNSEGNNGSD